MDPPEAPYGGLRDGDAVPLHATTDTDGATAAGPAPEHASGKPLRWKTNLALFVATVASVYATAEAASPSGGVTYAATLLAILLTHEFGHYIAARWHGVDASLPYFIPLPYVSPFGTMGAVISMRERIRSRNALLDIGAAGPLAGLVVAIPVLIVGLLQSPVKPIDGSGWLEGQSLLYVALKRIVLGPIPEGHDVFLSPAAFAGWSGLFVTALNLIPVGQLDGGHIAYALFGPRQNRYARILHAALLLLFAYNVSRFVVPVVLLGAWDNLPRAVSNSTFWLVWFVLLRLIGREHPPTEPGDLSTGRRAIAWLSLALFLLLLMPTPLSAY